MNINWMYFRFKLNESFHYLETIFSQGKIYKVSCLLAYASPKQTVNYNELPQSVSLHLTVPSKL